MEGVEDIEATKLLDCPTGGSLRHKPLTAVRLLEGIETTEFLSGFPTGGGSHTVAVAVKATKLLVCRLVVAHTIAVELLHVYALALLPDFDILKLLEATVHHLTVYLYCSLNGGMLGGVC